MAEGLWKSLGKGAWEVFSAGSKPTGSVHPLAIEVMKEIGIDLSECRSKHVDEFAHQPFSVVVTVCDGAQKTCPVFPGGAQALHWPFEDPAGANGPVENQRAVFRRVRDEIAAAIRAYLSFTH
jgi:arsenate reductase